MQIVIDLTSTNFLQKCCEKHAGHPFARGALVFDDYNYSLANKNVLPDAEELQEMVDAENDPYFDSQETIEKHDFEIEEVKLIIEKQERDQFQSLVG